MRKVYYTSGYKYQLKRKYRYRTALRPKRDLVVDFLMLQTDGWLVYDKGYAWDGPSGEIQIPPFLPAWLPSIRLDITKDGKKSMRSSLIHDGLYQLMRYSLLDIKHRKYADQLLKDICMEDGMSIFMATQWRNAVSNFAEDSALPKSKKKVLVAP